MYFLTQAYSTKVINGGWFASLLWKVSSKKICHNGGKENRAICDFSKTSLGSKNNHRETYKWHSLQARNLGAAWTQLIHQNQFKAPILRKEIGMFASPILPSSIVPCWKSIWPNPKVHIAIWLFCLVDFTCSFCQLHFAKLPCEFCYLAILPGWLYLFILPTPLCQVAKFTLPNWQVRIGMSSTPKSPTPHCYLPNLVC